MSFINVVLFMHFLVLLHTFAVYILLVFNIIWIGIFLNIFSVNLFKKQTTLCFGCVGFPLIVIEATKTI